MHADTHCTRRETLKALGSLGLAACAAPRFEGAGDDLVARNDEAVRRLLAAQVIDTASGFRGAVPDATGLHGAGSASGLLETMVASFVHPGSVFHRDATVRSRLELAIGFLERTQRPRGNIDLLTTNFDSPPDTGFVVHGVATAAAVARRYGADEIAERLRPFLVRAGAGLAVGGIHTPNHRWVVCAALAQIHALFPDPRYVRRIDEWLAEGIDIDADGQFTERSTLIYGPITDRALLTVALALGRADLLDPVRRNLRSLRWLLHADGEVVTDVSLRQDLGARGGVDRYWWPLTHLALADRDGEFATLARMAATGARLATLLEYPHLADPLPASAPLPDDFVQPMDALGIVRIRRGRRSVTLSQGGSSRLLSLRQGDVVIEGLRMAAAFFGKGQFVPDRCVREGDTWLLSQELEAAYYQPLAERVTPDTYYDSRLRRRRSETCRLAMTARVEETERGLRVRLCAGGTDGVPVAVEIALRAGAELLGGAPAPDATDAQVLASGSALVRCGRDELAIGPGAAPHRYTQIRGAEPRLAAPCLYVTGFTPFDHTLDFAAR